MNAFLVLLLGLVIVGAALMTVTRRNPIHAALSMLIALGGVGGLMLGLQSPFLAAMQVLLYGGAIMVLFTFVIMLLTLREDEMGPEPAHEVKLMAAVAAFFVLGVLWSAVSGRTDAAFKEPLLGDAFGSPEHFARFLYTDYAVAFELVTVLVLAAAAGVIVLARRPGMETLQGARLVDRAGAPDDATHGSVPPAAHHHGAAGEVHP